MPTSNRFEDGENKSSVLGMSNLRCVLDGQVICQVGYVSKTLEFR